MMKARLSLLLYFFVLATPAANVLAQDNLQIVSIKEGQNAEAVFDSSKDKLIFRYHYSSNITQLLTAVISGPEGKVEIKVTPGAAALKTSSAHKSAAKKKHRKHKKKKKKGKGAFRTSGKSWFAKMTLNGGTKLKDSFKLTGGVTIPAPPDPGVPLPGDDDDDDNSTSPPATGPFTPTQICQTILNAIIEGMQDHPDFVNITPNSAKQSAIHAFAIDLMRQDVPECFQSALVYVPPTAAALVSGAVSAVIYQPQKSISFTIDVIFTPDKTALVGGESYTITLNQFGPKNGPALNKLSESTGRWVQLQPATGLFGEVYHRVRFKGSTPVSFNTYEVKSYFGGYGYIFARDDSGTNEAGPFLSVLISKSLSAPFRAVVFPGTHGRWSLNWPGG